MDRSQGPAGKPEKTNLDTILAQCWVAFGHGAGGKHVTAGSVAALNQAYRPLLVKNKATWSKDSAAVLAYAHALGAAAAHVAARAGSVAIDGPATVKALALVGKARKGDRDPQIPCPFCDGTLT